MNKREFLKAISLLAAGCGFAKDVPEATAEVYWQILKDLPADAVNAAVINILAKHQYSNLPPVGQIRTEALRLSQPQIPTAIEAWGEVMRAIAKHGAPGEEEKALALLSPVTRDVVRSIGWRAINYCDNIDVIRGQFRKAYDEQAERSRERQAMPAEVRAFTERVAGQLGQGRMALERGKANV